MKISLYVVWFKNDFDICTNHLRTPYGLAKKNHLMIYTIKIQLKVEMSIFFFSLSLSLYIYIYINVVLFIYFFSKTNNHLQTQS